MHTTEFIDLSVLFVHGERELNSTRHVLHFCIKGMRPLQLMRTLHVASEIVFQLFAHHE